jgi:hypothetical protein
MYFHCPLSSCEVFAEFRGDKLQVSCLVLLISEFSASMNQSDRTKLVDLWSSAFRGRL